VGLRNIHSVYCGSLSTLQRQHGDQIIYLEFNIDKRTRHVKFDTEVVNTRIFDIAYYGKNRVCQMFKCGVTLRFYPTNFK